MTGFASSFKACLISYNFPLKCPRVVMTSEAYEIRQNLFWFASRFMITGISGPHSEPRIILRTIFTFWREHGLPQNPEGIRSDSPAVSPLGLSQHPSQVQTQEAPLDPLDFGRTAHKANRVNWRALLYSGPHSSPSAFDLPGDSAFGLEQTLQ